MGTRTYSRRGANGERIPTSLGIRSGRFSSNDNMFFAESELSAPLQDYLRKSHEQTISAVKKGLAFELMHSYAESLDTMTRLGLDPTNEDDIRTYADLVSVTPYKPKWTPTLEQAEAIVRADRFANIRAEMVRNPEYDAVIGQLIALQRIKESERTKEQRKEIRRLKKLERETPQRIPTGVIYPVTYETGAVRNVYTENGTIVIDNDSFNTSSNAPPGIGFLMVARQLQAARKIAARTGKPVRIETSAVSSKTDWSGQRSMTGAHVWPKLGYEFRIPSDVKDELRQQGFTDAQMTNTATLMLSKNERGQTGFDVWTDALNKALSRRTFNDETIGGYTTITPKSARSNNPSDFSLAEQVTRAYGQRRGFIKQAANRGVLNNFFSDNDAQDEVILRDIWNGLAKQRGLPT